MLTEWEADGLSKGGGGEGLTEYQECLRLQRILWHSRGEGKRINLILILREVPLRLGMLRPESGHEDGDSNKMMDKTE